ncbi:MAG: cytochrome C oxidase subunit IV family protein [Myxococcota bacterium]
MPDSSRAVAHAHPQPRTYLKVAVILTVITAVEVAIYYAPALRGVLVPALLLFSAVKFAIVVGYYMHLKFDADIYSRLFLGPLALAAIIVIVLMFLFGHFIDHGGAPSPT